MKLYEFCSYWINQYSNLSNLANKERKISVKQIFYHYSLCCWYMVRWLYFKHTYFFKRTEKPYKGPKTWRKGVSNGKGDVLLHPFYVFLPVWTILPNWYISVFSKKLPKTTFFFFSSTIGQYPCSRDLNEK